MDKYCEEFKEILNEQIKKIAKKGDITPQELDNVYKASAIVLDMETRKAMKNAEHEGEESQMNRYSQRGSYNRGSYNMPENYSNRDKSYNYNDGGQSNHYPWFMYHDAGNSYGPIWNQDKQNENMMHNNMNEMSNRSYNNYNDNMNHSNNMSNDGMSNAGRGRDADNDGRYSEDNNSYRRGRDARGRYTSRDRGYSREAEKERMIDQLEEMMDNASTEKERKAIMRCIDKLDS